MSPSIQPSLPAVRDLLSAAGSQSNPPNLIPLSATLSAEFLTPASIYLKLTARYVDPASQWMAARERIKH
ncbi:MAG: hypothetical protein INR71_06630 [Terriglobus roseus]|nr:hypothetical protein [Terriglobus roseus]